jgi:hypothetical protein
LINYADYQIGGGVALRLRTQGLPIWRQLAPAAYSPNFILPRNVVNECLTIATYIAGLSVKAMEEDMIAALKRSWWLGPFVASLAVATIATVQAAITIAGAVMHATSIKPLSSQELNVVHSFEERWPATFSTNWQRSPRTASIRD